MLGTFLRSECSRWIESRFFSLFGCKLKIVHFLSDGIYFFETNSSKNFPFFRSLEHRYRFFLKNLRNEIRIAQWEKKQKEEREKEGYPFECFARAQSFSSSGSGGGEGSVTIEEEEKIAERGGSCAPCDELISSNVAGTSWMRENWCASRFRIIARRYTARVRASREITLSAKLPRFDSVLCELHPSTSFSVCPFAWSQPCCKKSLSLWNPRVNSFAWKCSTPEERIRYLEMFINISSPIGTMQWRVFIYFLRIEAQLGRNKNIILNGLRRRCLVLLHSFVNNCVNCVNWEWFMGNASSSFLLSRCTFNDICLYDTSSLQSSDFIILGIFIKETSSTLSFPLDKIKKKYHDDYKLSFDLSPMIRLLLLNLRSPYL